jgi:hypothetical protein
MTSGSLGTNKDPATYWSPTQTHGAGRVRIAMSTGPRMPVLAWRCEGCSRIELTADAVE